MKKIKVISAAVLTAFGAVSALAQQAPMYTHYMYNTLVVNPAYAGSREALTVTALHRSQWLDFKGAPMTQTLTLHAPIVNENLGLGLAVSNDKIGPTNTTAVFGQFAYILKLNEKSKLAFGLSGGVNIMQANLSELQLDDQNDPMFQANTRNQVKPNFGFGAYYSRERFYAGVSSPDLLQNDLAVVTLADGSQLTSKSQRHYFFIAGAVFNLTPNLAFKPTTLVKVTAAAPIQADVTASFIIHQKLTLGAMYRSGDALGALLGVNLTDQLFLGYSFDWSYGIRTFKYNNGSHEIMLRYDFITQSKRQVHSPRYF